MNPSPSPVDAFVPSGPAEWWQIVAALGPLAILLAAVLAAAISWKTLRQRTTADALALAQKREADADALNKRLADDRSEWWRRAQWALDRALDDDEAAKALGLVTLEVLARSELARTEELELFDLAWQSVTRPTGYVAEHGSVPNISGESDPLVRLSKQLDGIQARLPGGWQLRAVVDIGLGPAPGCVDR